MTRRWPFPGDRPVDRARQVAQQYRTALLHADPGTCQALDTAATLAGETWIVPQVAQYTADDLVTVPEAAEIIGRSVRWVYAWVAADRAARAIIRSDKRIRVRARDILKADADERTE